MTIQRGQRCVVLADGSVMMICSCCCPLHACVAALKKGPLQYSCNPPAAFLGSAGGVNNGVQEETKALPTPPSTS